MAAHSRRDRAGRLTARDTIVALSSGGPPAAIAIVRVSGPEAMAVVEALAGRLPPDRQAGLRTLRQGGAVLDRALVLSFSGPATATGEDLVELHCHGGRAVVDAVQAALLARPGVRRAEPGEFTRRALANDRIDLAEAEGLADLLAADTEAQRRAAWDAAGGRLSRAVRGWMDRLALLSAEIEARIDYDEEGDVPAGDGTIAPALAALAAELTSAVAGPPVERWRDGIRVVIAGPPNAGKSTLLNALVGREVAIVTPIAGTTRDRIETAVTRGGIGYVLIDTAGLTETDDPVEAIGVERAREAAAMADVLLWVADAPGPAGSVHVHAKADLPGRDQGPSGAIVVSAVTGQGTAALWMVMAERARGLLPAADALALTRRQRSLVAAAADELSLTCSDWVLLAEHCRRALRHLGELIGVDATEAMLDALFGRFCLGK